MAENVLNLEKDIQIHESLRVPNKMTPLKHSVIKLSKVMAREKILKVVRKKELVIYRGIPIRPSQFFSRNIAGQREQHEYLGVAPSARRKILTTKNLLPSKVVL